MSGVLKSRFLEFKAHFLKLGRRFHFIFIGASLIYSTTVQTIWRRMIIRKNKGMSEAWPLEPVDLRHDTMVTGGLRFAVTFTPLSLRSRLFHRDWSFGTTLG